MQGKLACVVCLMTVNWVAVLQAIKPVYYQVVTGIYYHHLLLFQLKPQICLDVHGLLRIAK